MTINDFENLFMFAGGLGMFLFGVHSMSGGVQKCAGEQMRKLLGILTNNRFVGVLVGALITAVIQSSGATTVMIIGFINAGLMNLSQAVGPIMGANIGTCITAWIVSLGQLGDTFKTLSPSLYAPLIVAIGSFLIMFSKKERKQTIGEICIGLGLLFIGLDFMGDAAKSYTTLPAFKDLFALFGANPLLGIGLGFIVTVIMQSSSAAVGILQTLAASSGAVGISAAVFISFGSDIGSCSTALLSSIGTNRTAKRAAMIHLLFNVIGVTVFSVISTILFKMFPEVASHGINSAGIATFHTGFKVVLTILMFPFADYLVKLSGFFIKDEPEKEKEEKDEETVTLQHLDSRIFKEPAFAIENAIHEVAHMGRITRENMDRAFEAALSYDKEKIDKVYEVEKTINNMEKLITEYLVKLSNLPLTEDQHVVVSNLFYSVSDIERVGDHVENIAELVDVKEGVDKIEFSEQALQDLKSIMGLVTNSFAYAMSAREHSDISDAKKVVKYEDMVDNMEEELREQHIERLSKQLCKPTNGVVFLDIISNLERISDHAYNLAGYVISEE